jgi:hypothetical protein
VSKKIVVGTEAALDALVPHPSCNVNDTSVCAFMNIKIDSKLGTVRVDVTTDIDHLAKYRLFIWKKNAAEKWELCPDAVQPEFSHTADPADHSVTMDVMALKDALLQLVAKVNSLVKDPGNLDLKVKVHQDPSGIASPSVSPVMAYGVDFTQPVPFGTDVQIVASYPFEIL